MCNEKNRNKKMREELNNIFVYDPTNIFVVTKKTDSVVQKFIAKKKQEKYYEIFSEVELTNVVNAQKLSSLTKNYDEKLSKEEVFNYIVSLNIKEIGKLKEQLNINNDDGK